MQQKPLVNLNDLPLYKVVEVRKPGATYSWKVTMRVDDIEYDHDAEAWVVTDVSYQTYQFCTSEEAAARLLIRLEGWDSYCARLNAVEDALKCSKAANS